MTAYSRRQRIPSVRLVRERITSADTLQTRAEIVVTALAPRCDQWEKDQMIDVVRGVLEAYADADREARGR